MVFLLRYETAKPRFLVKLWRIYPTATPCYYLLTQIVTKGIMTSRFYTLLTPENPCHETANLKLGFLKQLWRIYPSSSFPASGSLKESLNILTSKFHTSTKPAMWKNQQYANALFFNFGQVVQTHWENCFRDLLLLNLFHFVHAFAFLQCAHCCRYLITRQTIEHPRVQLNNFEQR